jgi:hypothetical protein
MTTPSALSTGNLHPLLCLDLQSHTPLTPEVLFCYRVAATVKEHMAAGHFVLAQTAWTELFKIIDAESGAVVSTIIQ